MTTAMKTREKRCQQLLMAEFRWFPRKNAYVGIYPWNNDQEVPYKTIIGTTDTEWNLLISAHRALKALSTEA